TLDICREYTDKIFINPWPGWIEQKNLAISKSRNKWILSLDSDERVSKELKEEIAKELTIGGCDVYYIPIRPFYLGKPITHCGWYPGYKLRFFNKEKSKWGGVEPHESLIFSGRSKKLKGNINHFAYDSIEEHLIKINYYSKAGADLLIKKGKRIKLSDLVLRPVFTFFKQYILQTGFLDGWRGFLVCAFSSYANLAKYSRAWEMQKSIELEHRA
ncbi:MAG: glycosyltransferase family 2 protein, partial [bacterium]|nr:glycosyltransferase family 2 protein [bacterium]